MVSLGGTHVRYKPDNSKVKGMGGLLMSGGVQKTANRAAAALAAMIPSVAAANEATAQAWGIEPGWITSAYSEMSFKPKPVALVDGGHINLRKATRIVFERSPGNVHGAPVQSGVVTLEFGSHYNEGTRTDRPALGVLSQSIRAFAASRVGIVEKTKRGPLRVPRG